MKITKLILHKYKRLFLNDITTLEYTPESAIQLILGSNGSGKSSLLAVLNPLPLDIKNKFNEGGYGEIHITKDGREFVLISGKDKVGKYNFIVDNIERNEGGTKRAQLQLVEEYFNLTPRMNEIILGTKTLTNMSTIERKEWFRHLSTVDYTYSISTYNKLKNRLRDVIGGIKLLTTEITKDADALLKEEDITEYGMHIVHIKKAIENLMFNYNHKATNSSSVSNEIHNLTTKLDKLYKDDYSVYTVSEVEIKVNLLKHDLINIDKELDIVNINIDKIDYIEKNDNDEDKLKSELKDVEKEMLPINNIFEDIDIDKTLLGEMHKVYNHIYIDLISHTNDLSNHDNIVLTLTIHGELSLKVTNLHNNINLKQVRLVSYQEEQSRLKESLNEDNKITCSNCSTVSYFGYDEKRLSYVNENIVILTKDIDVLKEELGIYQNKLIEVNQKLYVIDRIKDIIGVNNILLPIWSIIFKDTPLYEVTSYKLLMKFEEFKHLLGISYKYPILLERQSDLINKLTILKEVKKVKDDLANNTKQDLLTRFEKLTTGKKQTISKLDIYSNILKELVMINDLDIQLRGLLKDNKVNKRNEIELIKNGAIKDMVSILKINLLELEDKILDNSRIVNKLNNNQRLLLEYKHKQKVLTRTITALSPTEGLIAKSINSFINKILMEINTIINEVWSYNMKLLPCEISDENDLDYLFRVQVDNREIIDDVSNLSSSMKEIVNLAFKIVFMKYGKLSFMPLILDEFGVTMDSTHRHNAYNVIDNILSANFDQIFITAHFQSMYLRLGESDVNILDDRNIELNSDIMYNTRLVIV